MLNEHMSCIRNIVKEHHNETITKHHLQHGSTIEQLRNFNEGDILYCHFPSKTTISQMRILSHKFAMSYVGLLNIFARYDKYMYTLATLNGEIIEQMFHVSHLKKRLCDNSHRSNGEQYN